MGEVGRRGGGGDDDVGDRPVVLRWISKQVGRSKHAGFAIGQIDSRDDQPATIGSSKGRLAKTVDHRITQRKRTVARLKGMVQILSASPSKTSPHEGIDGAKHVTGMIVATGFENLFAVTFMKCLHVRGRFANAQRGGRDRAR